MQEDRPMCRQLVWGGGREQDRLCPGECAGGSAFEVPSTAGAWGLASSHLSYGMDHSTGTPPQHSRACGLPSSLPVVTEQLWQ